MNWKTGKKNAVKVTKYAIVGVLTFSSTPHVCVYQGIIVLRKNTSLLQSSY